MKVWSVVNQKGGVGKTTTALTLAGLAVEHGYRVLLIDLDPHGSLTHFFRLDINKLSHSAFDFFNPAVPHTELTTRKLFHSTALTPLTLIPASPALATIERKPQGADGMGAVIAQALSLVKSSADIVIIDGPPMLGMLMVNAINAADTLIIPVQTEYLALKGLEQMMKTLGMFSTVGQAPTQRQFIVPTLFDRRTHASVAALEQLRDDYGDKLWAGQIVMDTKFRNAMETGILPHKLSDECFGVNGYRLLLESLLAETLLADTQHTQVKKLEANR